MKKKILFSFLAVLLLVGGIFMLAGCQKEEETYKIGATLALSGAYAYFGQAELRGMELAVEEINSEGGINNKKIELKVEDNAGDAVKAVTDTVKLLNVDNVDLMVSAFTHITSAVKDPIIEKGVPLFYISTVRTFAEESPYIFRDYFDVQDNGEAMIDLLKAYNKEKVVYIGENSELCALFLDTVKENMGENFEIVHEEIYESDEKDFKTQLLKITKFEKDAILTCTWRHEDKFMKQLKELDMMDVQTFHLVAPYMPHFQTRELEQLFAENNAVSTWYGFQNFDDSRIAKDFANKYQLKYGENPNADNAYAYDDIKFIAKALEACDKEGKFKDKDCLRQKLIETTMVGAGGIIDFDENGVSKRPVTFIKSTEKGWVDLKI